MNFCRRWILALVIPTSLGAFSVVSTQALADTPVLLSIEPHAASVGQHLTLTGQGLDAPHGRIIVDGGSYYLDAYLKLNPDGTVGFDLPRLLSPAMHRPANPGVHILWARPLLQPGQHTFSVETADGTSNTLTFTVLSFPGMASLDASALVQSTGCPTLRGTAQNLSEIKMQIGVLDKPQKLRGGPTGYTLPTPIPVVNGRWSVDLQGASSPTYDPYTLCPLEPGRYRITVWDPKTLVHIPLPQSTLTITAPTR